MMGGLDGSLLLRCTLPLDLGLQFEIPRSIAENGSGLIIARFSGDYNE